MPRKSYSIEERQRVKETLMTTVLQCIIDRGLIHSSIDVLCRKVGISKTFFLHFFLFKRRIGHTGSSVSTTQTDLLCAKSDG